MIKALRALTLMLLFSHGQASALGESIFAPVTLSSTSQIQVFGAFEGSKLGWLIDPSQPNHSVLVIILTDATNSVRVLPFALETVREDPTSLINIRKASLVVEDLDPHTSLTQKIRYEVEYYVNDVSARSVGQHSTSVILTQASESSVAQPQMQWDMTQDKMSNQVLSLENILPADTASDRDVRAPFGSQLEAKATLSPRGIATKLVISNRVTQSRTVWEKTKNPNGSFGSNDTRFGSLTLKVRGGRSKSPSIQNLQLITRGSDANPPNLLRATDIASVNLSRETPIQVLLEARSPTSRTNYLIFSYQRKIPRKEATTEHGLIIKNDHTNLVVPLRSGFAGGLYGRIDYFDPNRGRMIEQNVAIASGLDAANATQVRVTVHDPKTNDNDVRLLTFKKPARKTVKPLGSFQAAPWISKAHVFCSRLGASPRWRLCVPKNALEKNSRKHNAVALWDEQTGSTQIIDAKWVRGDAQSVQLQISHEGGMWFSPFFDRYFALLSPTFDLKLNMRTTPTDGVSIMSLNWMPRLGALYQAIPNEQVHLISPKFANPASSRTTQVTYSGRTFGPSVLCQQLLSQL